MGMVKGLRVARVSGMSMTQSSAPLSRNASPPFTCSEPSPHVCAGPVRGITRAPHAGVSPPPRHPRGLGVPEGSPWAAGVPWVRPCGAMGMCTMILLSYCSGDRRPLHAEPRHHHGRAWGASPVAGGRELRSPGATDVNFRSQGARNVDVLSHRGPALNLLSPSPFRC